MTIGNALVLAPFWEEHRFHPHRRRVEQWLEMLNLAGLRTKLIALGRAGRVSTSDQYFDTHPRYASPSSFVLAPKTAASWATIKGKLRQVAADVISKNGAPDIAVLAHPMLADCMDEWLPESRTVVDFPDVVVSGSRAHIGAYQSSLGGRNAVVLSEVDLERLKEMCDAALQMAHIGPLPHIGVPEARRGAVELCLFGRAAAEAYSEVLRVMTLFVPASFRDRLHMRAVIAGEVSRSIRPEFGIEVAGPSPSLQRVLSGRVCVIPTPPRRTGVSYRVLEAIEAGAMLVTDHEMVQEFGLTSGRQYLSCGSPGNAQEAVGRVILHPAEAVKRAQFAQRTLKEYERGVRLGFSRLIESLK